MGRGRRRRPKGLGWERRRGLMTAIVLVLYAHPSEDCRRRRSLKETQDDAGLGYSPCLFLCCVCRPSQSRPAQGRERERDDRVQRGGGGGGGRCEIKNRGCQLPAARQAVRWRCLGWGRRRGLMTAIILVLYETCRRRRSLKETQDDAGLGYIPCLFLCCVCVAREREAIGCKEEEDDDAK